MRGRPYPLERAVPEQQAISGVPALHRRTRPDLDGSPSRSGPIGHEVFGRDPGYDTGQDPVVRMTATEVRKRLGSGTINGR